MKRESLARRTNLEEGVRWLTIPRENNLPYSLEKSNREKKTNIQWINVSEEQKADLEESFRDTGVNLTNIRTIRYEENTEKDKGVIATYNMQTHELVVKSKYYELNPLEQLSIWPHEIDGHAYSPLNPENDKFYGEGLVGREKRQEILKDAQMVANQTLETHVYLSTYHKNLTRQYEQVMNTELDPEKRAQAAWIYVEETDAEMRRHVVKNPNHVIQVTESQQAVMRKKGLGDSVVDVFALSEKSMLAIHPEFGGNVETMRAFYAESRRKLVRKYGPQKDMDNISKENEATARAAQAALALV